MNGFEPIAFKKSNNIQIKKISIFANEEIKPNEPQESEDEILSQIRKKAYDEAYQKGMTDSLHEINILKDEKLDEAQLIVDNFKSEIQDIRDSFTTTTIEIIRRSLYDVIDSEFFNNSPNINKTLNDIANELYISDFKIIVSSDISVTGDNVTTDPQLPPKSIKISTKDMSVNVDVPRAIESRYNRIIEKLTSK